MTSKLLTLSADGNTATVAVATGADIASTIISTDRAVTGTYGLVQKVAIFVAGMAVQNKRVGGGYNPFGAQ